ncbi:hypothetical protein CZ787_02305 [Halomonas citrativorans]|uniref:Uncharacterized protein n=1 Tax=Halomonas citrativorans TaxID=2742612 RepID=A0A1R4HQK9_9GAMM|nr:hypothetical protein CZ787_02305 [Halomonas citrativorans]
MIPRSPWHLIYPCALTPAPLRGALAGALRLPRATISPNALII